jgi:hypothetical protein
MLSRLHNQIFGTVSSGAPTTFSPVPDEMHENVGHSPKNLVVEL